MLVSIHQPEFLPWLPFFDKMDRADVFVLLDNVQFEKNYFQNRCKVRDGKGSYQLVTIPVSKGSSQSLIMEKELDTGNRLLGKALLSLEFAYRKTTYFNSCFTAIKDIILSERMLGAMNINLIRLLAKEIGITTTLMVASELGVVTGAGGTRVTGDICKHLGASQYLSGKMGADYLDTSYFDDLGIEVLYQDYECVVYPQAGETKFISALSVIDLLFNAGPHTLECIRKGRQHGP